MSCLLLRHIYDILIAFEREVEKGLFCILLIFYFKNEDQRNFFFAIRSFSFHIQMHETIIKTITKDLSTNDTNLCKFLLFKKVPLTRLTFHSHRVFFNPFMLVIFSGCCY